MPYCASGGILIFECPRACEFKKKKKSQHAAEKESIFFCEKR